MSSLPPFPTPRPTLIPRLQDVWSFGGLGCTLGIVGVLFAPRLLHRPPVPPKAAPNYAAAATPETGAAGDDAKAQPPQAPALDRVPNHVWSDGRGVVWVAGEAGRIFRSADHGETFARVPMPTRKALIGLTGSRNGSVLVATDREVYRSRDQGASWKQAAKLQRTPAGAEPTLTGLYSDGTTLWASAANDDDDSNAVYSMALEGRHLDPHADRYDSIRAVVGRRGAVLVLNVVYNCHSGDYIVVDRLARDRRTFRRVESGADNFAYGATDSRTAYMTPSGSLYILTGWVGDRSAQKLARRRAGAADFEQTPLAADAVWASDDGEAFVTTPEGGVRRSTDHGGSFGPAVPLPG